MTHLRLSVLALAVAMAGLTGCRGSTSREPPVHLNPNMDTQDKYKSYRKSTFFKDQRTMRTPPKGTVAKGKLRANDALHCGKTNTTDCAGHENGDYITKLPIQLDMKVMKRGRDRYNIFCAPCHDKAGYGDGKVAVRSKYAIKPPTFHSKRMGEMPVGQIYHTIAYGSKSKAMSGYLTQITDVKDRWAIVAYVRALQRSQSAKATRYRKPAPPPPPPAPVVPAPQPGSDGANPGVDDANKGANTGTPSKTGGAPTTAGPAQPNQPNAAPAATKPAAPAAPAPAKPAAPAAKKPEK